MKKGILVALLAVLFVVPCVFLFSACGNKNTDKQISYITCTVSNSHWSNESQSFVYSYGEEINIQKSDISVTAHYADGTSGAYDNFTVDASDVNGKTLAADTYYYVRVSTGENAFTNILSVYISKAPIAIPTGLTFVSDTSFDFRDYEYDGNSIDALSDLDALQDSDSKIAPLIESEIVTMYGDSVETNANYIDGRDEWSFYAFGLNTDENHIFVAQSGEEFQSISVIWRINPKVLRMPTISQSYFIYDGQPHQPTLSLPDETSVLSIQGNDAQTEVGMYLISVSIDADNSFNYCFAMSQNDIIRNVVFRWQIVENEPVAIDSLSFEDKTVSYNKDGQQNNIEIDLLKNPITGVESIEYSYYSNNVLIPASSVVEVGTYSVHVHVEVETGYAQVEDSDFTLTIAPLDISTLTLSDIGANNIQVPFRNAAYTTNDFSGHVYEAVSASDYSDLTYELQMGSGVNVDNTNASSGLVTGKLLVVATGTNYSGTLEIPFTILHFNASSFDVQAANIVYDGTAKEVEVYAYLFGSNVLLVENTDYTVVYSNNTNAGTASFTITGIGNYSGSKNGTFEIAQQVVDLSNLEWDLPQEGYTYDGTVKSLTINNLPAYITPTYAAYSQLNYVEGEEIFIAGNIVPFKNAGYYYYAALLTIDSNNYIFQNGESTMYFAYGNNDQIQIASVEATLVYSGPTSFEYTGSAIHPIASDFKVSITVSGDEVPLENGTDYTLSFDDDAIDVDGYYVTVNLSTNYHFVMAGNNYNQDSIYYAITARELDQSELTITNPTVYKEVWSNNYCLANPHNGSIEITSSNTVIESEFYVTYDYTLGYVLRRVVRDTNYSCTVSDFVIGANYTLTNPRNLAVSINGNALSLADIASLSTLDWGDYVEISCDNATTISYVALASSGYNISNGTSSVSFYAGTEGYTENVYDENDPGILLHETGELYFESTARIEFVADNEFVAGKDLDIVRGQLFDHFVVAGTTLVPAGQQYKEGYWVNYRDMLADTSDTVDIEIENDYLTKYSVTIVEDGSSNVAYNQNSGYTINFAAVTSITVVVTNTASNKAVASITVTERQS